MKNSKGLKALGLSILAVLGMMAFSAVGASAALPEESTTGLFLLLSPGQSFETEKVTEVPASGEQPEPGRLVVPERKIIIGCKKGKVEEGKIQLNVAHAKFKFEECTVWTLIKGTQNPHEYALGSASPCHITNLEVTAKAKIKVTRHGGEKFILAEPLEGTTFTKFTFLAGTGCPLPLSNEVSGSVGALITQEQVVNQGVILSPAIQLLLGDKLLYGAFESYIEAEGIAKLTGAWAGQAFGAH